MDKSDLKNISGIRFKKFKKLKDESKLLGDPVLRIDRGYGEYGIITGFVNGLVLVHFANYPFSLRINPNDLYIPISTRK